MRKVGRCINSDRAKWVVLYMATEVDGVYLFPLASDLDGSGTGDGWYMTMENALWDAENSYV